MKTLGGDTDEEDDCDDWLIVTLPTASYLCSAGTKCEMTLVCLSGDLTATVRVRANLEAREAAEREAAARAASAARRAAAADLSDSVDTNTALDGVGDCLTAEVPSVTPAVAS